MIFCNRVATNIYSEYILHSSLTVGKVAVTVDSHYYQPFLNVILTWRSFERKVVCFITLTVRQQNINLLPCFLVHNMRTLE